VRARGHDPARRIALAAAGELRRAGMPARVLAVLRQRRAVADQSGLNSRQRLDNLAGALEVASGGVRLMSRGARVVLVDDLMTTGASLAEASRALRVAFAERADECEQICDFYGRVTPQTMGGEVSQATGAGGGRSQAVVGMGGPNGAGVMISAAVVAARPASFETNWN
ncbi:ComF family protein, partial [Streptomyces montanus]|uniref:ComF family protein n=1 Tax=Streptomyces montanus TaxID=2580423 RepID=UPI001BB1B490